MPMGDVLGPTSSIMYIHDKSLVAPQSIAAIVDDDSTGSAYISHLDGRLTNLTNDLSNVDQ